MAKYHYCAMAYSNGNPVAIQDGILSTEDDLSTDAGYQRLRENMAANFRPPQPAISVVITTLTQINDKPVGTDIAARVLQVAEHFVASAEKPLALAERNAFAAIGIASAARDDAFRGLGALDVLQFDSDEIEALRVRAGAVISSSAKVQTP